MHLSVCQTVDLVPVQVTSERLEAMGLEILKQNQVPLFLDIMMCVTAELAPSQALHWPGTWAGLGWGVIGRPTDAWHSSFRWTVGTGRKWRSW